MNRVVLTHPLPGALRQAARDALGARDFTVLVPNAAAGKGLRFDTRAPLRTRTLGQHARAVLEDAGWKALRWGEAAGVAGDLLAELDLEYLATVRERASTAASVAALLRALGRSDVSSPVAAHAPQGARERDVARIFEAFVARLTAERRFDPALAEYFAARAPVRPEPVLLTGFAYLDAAQLRFVNRAAAAGSVATLPHEDGARALREAQRTLAGLERFGWTHEALAGGPEHVGEGAALAFLRGARRDDPHVAVHASPDVEAEVRAALRAVKRAGQAGAPWHRLAVVVRDEAAYLPVLADVADEYEVPLLSGAQVPLGATPLGGLLRAWMDALTGGWRFADARRLLLHPLLRLPFDAAARVRAFRHRSPGGLRVWSEDPLTARLELPPRAPGWTYLRELTDVLGAFGVTDHQTRDPKLGAALAALRDALRPLERAPDLDRAAFAEFVRSALSGATVPALLTKGGARVLTPLAMLGRTFDAVWILGLADGVFPARPGEHPLLDAHARRGWSQRGASVSGPEERAAVERALFHHALCGATRRLTLSRPERGPDGRRLAPSPFLAAFGPGVPVGEVQSGSGVEERAHLAALGRLDDARIAALAGLEAARERGDTAAQPRALPGGIDPLARPWSASQLHDFGACRYRWFAKSALGLRPEPEPAEDLDPLMTGNLYHLALRYAVEGVLGSDDATREAIAARLPEAFERAERELRAHGDLATGPLWPLERGEHEETLRRAVLAPDFLPDGWVPTDVERPLDGTLEVGGEEWAFRGFADRVDRTPGGDVVTDYKLSEYVSLVRGTSGRLDVEVQLPVYLRLTEARQGRYYSLRKRKVLRGAGHGWKKNGRLAYDPGGHAREVDAFLAGVRRDVRAGDFRAEPDRAGKACAYCDVAAVCRFQTFKTDEVNA